MTQEQFAAYHQQPRQLNLEEINDPYQVIDEFFSYYSLPGAREDLKRWYHAALEDDVMAASGKLSNLFSFYQNLERLIEASYLISKKHDGA